MEEVDIVGIDLGTTNSAIAVWRPEAGAAELLPVRDGGPLLRSVVYYQSDTGSAVVGAQAVGHLVERPDAVAYSVKRFMGRTASDDGVASDRDHVTFDVVEEASHHRLMLHVGPRQLTPTQVSAEVLRALKNDATAALGRPVDRAVITVPAYFQEPQRQATKEAGSLAGFDVARIVSEPTAAALAFGLGLDTQTVLVYDLGGGTFDVSIVSVDDGLFRVRGTSGNTHLGGDDFDRAIAGWLTASFEREHNVTLPVGDNRIGALLLIAAEQAKIPLTDEQQHRVQLPDVLDSLGLDVSIDQSTLRGLVAPLIEQTLDICDKLLTTLERDKGFRRDAIDQVLLVGGQTRMPAVKEALRERFGFRINDQVDPDQAVAQGAAVLGARLSGLLTDRVRLWDVIPLSLGIELADGRFEPIVRANAQIPIEIWRRGSNGFTTKRDRQDQIRFRIFQGERPLAGDNTPVGEIVLGLDEPREAGAARVACLFRIDQDGILHVRAEDETHDATGVEAVFDRAYQLSRSEIDASRRDADVHADEDALTRRLLELSEQLTRLQDRADEATLAAARRAIDERDATRAEELIAAAATETTNRLGPA